MRPVLLLPGRRNAELKHGTYGRPGLQSCGARGKYKSSPWIRCRRSGARRPCHASVSPRTRLLLSRGAYTGDARYTIVWTRTNIISHRVHRGARAIILLIVINRRASDNNNDDDDDNINNIRRDIINRFTSRRRRRRRRVSLEFLRLFGSPPVRRSSYVTATQSATVATTTPRRINASPDND